MSYLPTPGAVPRQRRGIISILAPISDKRVYLVKVGNWMAQTQGIVWGIQCAVFRAVLLIRLHQPPTWSTGHDNLAHPRHKI